MASAYGSDDKNQLKLYSYWRSSCAFRVRIALNLKGLNYEYRAVNLLKGEQFSAEFTKLNPLGYVPVLMDGDIILADSFAIIMYLEEKYPQHSLLPKDLQKRGINYQAANIVSSSIQPFQNLGTLKYIKEKVGPNEDLAWAKYHIEKGFVALEKLLKDYAGRYATGDEVFLVPPENLRNSLVSVLVFANNNLGGCIPDSIGKMGKTLNEIILLSDNLTGCLPLEIGLLRNLTVFDVSFNHL